MTITRRRVLEGAAAVAMAGAFGRTSFAVPVRELKAVPAFHRLAPPQYPETSVWGYDGRIPGPVIRVAQGERVTRRFVNALPQASTIHWHGIRIANAMDGVPGLTQEVVEPGAEFLYDFEVPDAGTYWFHPHNRTWEQMARGLYGALIVTEADPPRVDRDEVLLIDDWRLGQDGQIEDTFDRMMDWSHAGRTGNWLTVNGDGFFKVPARENERLRLRLANTANASIFPIALRGLKGWIVALDGQPLDAPIEADDLTLAPAQRIDLIVDVTGKSGESAKLVYLGQDSETEFAEFVIDGTARAQRLARPAPLAPNPVPEPKNLEAAKRVTLRMEGGAMGRMLSAKMGGRELGLRQLADAGKAWAFNGLAEMPKDPLVLATMGETVRIDIINDTVWPHAMHLHGHHFRQIMADGTLGPWRDTLLLTRDQRAEIAFVADNPGDWLFHCHMLEHAAAGMMTWLRVSA